MIRIYSPTGSESVVAKFVFSFLRDHDIKAYIDEVGNVIAGEGDLLLCSHIDTIPGELTVSVEGDFIRGRGAVDAKGPAAAYVMATIESGGACSLALVVEEEGKSRGMRHLLRDFEWKSVLIGEPSKINTIVVGYRGRMLLKLKTRGTATHVSDPCPDNAVIRAFDIFREIETELPKQDSLFESCKASLTQIEGGEAANVIPENCEATVDIRIAPKQMESVVQIIDKVKKREGNKAEITIAESILPVYQPDSKISKILAKSIEKWGLKPRFVKKAGSCDMNLIGERAEVASYGPGDPKMSHTNHEKLSLTEYNSAIDILLDFIKSF